MAGFVERGDGGDSNNRFVASNALKQLSAFGMKYDDMVLRNSQAVGIVEDQFGWTYDPRGLVGGDYDDYALFANLALSDIALKKSISVFDKSYPKKREELRRFAVQDEIEEILDTLCDECIVYDDKNYFADPLLFDDDLLAEDKVDEVRGAIDINFKRIYQYFGFNNDITAWSYFRKWLVDGYLAFEIIYDNSQRNIIGFKELDPISLEP